MALPVTGDWAICQNPEVVHQHRVKVYAPGAPGAPPMSMPHLDYRTIGGKEVLLFGPFGSMTMKFLRRRTSQSIAARLAGMAPSPTPSGR